VTHKEFYLQVAELFATRSKDPKFKVGAVIVTTEGILYPGYNGDEIGGNNQRDSMETGKSGFVHAEANAILKFNPALHKNCTMFLNYNPCAVCARMIVNTQSIVAVYYSNEYEADMSGVNILKRVGIICEKK
jgi:deoxycytidylate deaminase